MNHIWLRKLTPLLLIITITACGETKNSSSNNNTSTNTAESQQTQTEVKGKVIKSQDGQTQVLAPKSWSIQKDLNDVADLQIADVSKENYLIVISEPKSDFDNISVEKYSEMTRGFILDSIQGGKLSEPKNLTINGSPALQYQITGSVDGINIVYLHTSVEGSDGFHQVLAWTLPSRLDKNGPVLESVINSFQEN